MARVVLAFSSGLLRHSLAALLEYDGHEVEFIEDAALRRAGEKLPDIAIVGPECVTAMRRLRSERPLLPIIAIGLPEAASIGATIALPNSCDPAEFREAVRWSLCASGAVDRLKASGAIGGTRPPAF